PSRERPPRTGPPPALEPYGAPRPRLPTLHPVALPRSAPQHHEPPAADEPVPVPGRYSFALLALAWPHYTPCGRYPSALAPHDPSQNRQPFLYYGSPSKWHSSGRLLLFGRSFPSCHCPRPRPCCKP